MFTQAVVGVYDSLARAEKAEFRLEEAHLPVGQMTLLAPKVEDGQIAGPITAPGVAEAVAEAGVRLDGAQIMEYERQLQAGKPLVIFAGDADQAARAYRALEHTDNDELTLLGG
jgi:hypothetical protein